MMIGARSTLQAAVLIAVSTAFCLLVFASAVSAGASSPANSQQALPQLGVEQDRYEVTAQEADGKALTDTLFYVNTLQQAEGRWNIVINNSGDDFRGVVYLENVHSVPLPELLHPELMRGDLRLFVEALDLDLDQKTIAEMLLEEYREQFDEAAEALRHAAARVEVETGVEPPPHDPFVVPQPSSPMQLMLFYSGSKDGAFEILPMFGETLIRADKINVSFSGFEPTVLSGRSDRGSLGRRFRDVRLGDYNAQLSVVQVAAAAAEGAVEYSEVAETETGDDEQVEEVGESGDLLAEQDADEQNDVRAQREQLEELQGSLDAALRQYTEQMVELNAQATDPADLLDQARKFRSLRNRLMAQFSEHLELILNERQRAELPAAFRLVRRVNDIPRGKLSGESINIWNLLRAHLGPRERTTLIDQLLGDLDIAVDVALTARSTTLIDNELESIGLLIKPDDGDACVRMVRREADRRVAVRNQLVDAANRLGAVLDPQSAAGFSVEANVQGFPTVYRTTYVDRVLKAALGGEVVATDVVEALQALVQEYRAKRSALDLRLRLALLEEEPKYPVELAEFQRDMGDVVAGRDRFVAMRDSDLSPPSMKRSQEIITERSKLEQNTIRQVSKLVGREKMAELTSRSMSVGKGTNFHYSIDYGR